MDKDQSRDSTLFTRKKQLRQDFEQLSQEMYKRNLELNESNQMLSLFRKIDDAVLDSTAKIEDVSQLVADAVVGLSSVSMAALFVQPEDATKLCLAGLGWDESFANKPSLDKKSVRIGLEIPWLAGPNMSASVDVAMISSEQVAQTLDITTEQAKALAGVGLRSLVAHKLIVRYRIVGLLVVGLPNTVDTIDERHWELFNRIANAVGLAIDNKMLFEENQKMLRQVQRSNSKLEKLDETKDEFISMASHQLRTPLTSVKGYLSMVLEGDAGDISDMQRKLLDQAFVSSQRMVYLIADLLNLSRLKTGKFIIDAVPTNLAQVIEDEVGQLKETAASRNLSLTYKKPADFPTVMLDETKIRQVIMNFTDNAIYYTPSGGHIELKLEDTGKTIQFTVNDDGIGIPKKEQPHMFTKFFRAGNAKKARPDGTGLGLFMVKKVIVAQGGSIIFKSVEGKGSTFGFAFDKSRLEVPEQTPDKPIEI